MHEPLGAALIQASTSCIKFVEILIKNSHILNNTLIVQIVLSGKSKGYKFGSGTEGEKDLERVMRYRENVIKTQYMIFSKN